MSPVFVYMSRFTESVITEKLAFSAKKIYDQKPLYVPNVIKRVAKKGISSGKEFWSYSSYPKCNGTRKAEK